MNKSDFRIKEYDDRFVIEKRVREPKLVILCFILTEREKWVTYDDNVKFQDRLINPFIKGGYDSLESAKERLEKILEEPKYHYL